MASKLVIFKLVSFIAQYYQSADLLQQLRKVQDCDDMSNNKNIKPISNT